MTNRNEVQNVARQAIENEHILNMARTEVAMLESKASELIDKIQEVAKLELWSAIPGPPAFIWIERLPGHRRSSISYPSAEAAYRALLNDTIEWQE